MGNMQVASNVAPRATNAAVLQRFATRLQTEIDKLRLNAQLQSAIEKIHQAHIKSKNLDSTLVCALFASIEAVAMFFLSGSTCATIGLAVTLASACIIEAFARGAGQSTKDNGLLKLLILDTLVYTALDYAGLTELIAQTLISVNTICLAVVATKIYYTRQTDSVIGVIETNVALPLLDELSKTQIAATSAIRSILTDSEKKSGFAVVSLASDLVKTPLRIEFGSNVEHLLCERPPYRKECSAAELLSSIECLPEAQCNSNALIDSTKGFSLLVRLS